MTRGLNGASRDISRLAWRPSSSSICTSCLYTTTRHASTAAASAPSAANEPIPVPPSQKSPNVINSTQPHQAYNVRAGIVLSRAPLITRDLHPFEKAFFLYQRRLNERTALPFSRYFYYARDTPGDVDWKRKVKERQTAARYIGVYNAYRNNPWNDEVLIGAKESEPEHTIDVLIKDATSVEKDKGEGEDEAEVEGLSRKKELVVERPASRITEADEKGDTKSLNRKLARTLYLIVKGEKGGWEFPAGNLEGNESLHRAAERLMVQAGGVNMNTWIVGNAPVGHFVNQYEKSITDEKKIERLGEKTFYMKARILAGQADLAKNALGLKEYKWLAKEELQKELAPEYYRAVKNMLVDI